MSQVAQQKALIGLVADVISGKANPAELEVALVISRQSLEAMEEDWQRTVDELTPAQRTATEDICEQIHAMLDTASTGIDLLGTAISTRNVDELFQGGELIRRCSSQLDLLFSMYRNLALVALGPSDIPNLNLLLNTLDSARSGKTDLDGFLNVVNQERLFTLKALDDLEGNPKTSEYAALKRTFEDHLRCMNRLAKAVEARDEHAIDEEMKKADKSFKYLQELIPLASLRSRTDGPTKSQLANLVINLAFAVAHGQAHQDMLREHVDLLKKDIGPLAMAVKAAAPVATVMIEQETRRAVEALKGYEDAIKGFELFFQTRDTLLLQGAANGLRAAADELYSCWNKLQELADQEGKVACLRCNFYNTPDRRQCGKCGALLPILAEKSTATSTFAVESASEVTKAPEVPVESSNLARIYKAVDDFGAKRIARPEFEKELEWFINLIDLQERALPDAPETNLEGLEGEELEEAQKRAELVRETEQAFHGGIELWRQAVDQWVNYLETGERERRLLDEGKELCDQGARMLLTLALATKASEGAASE